MKAKYLVISAIFVAFFSIILALNKCSSGTTAHVTINLKSQQLSHSTPNNSLFQKLLNLFISPAYAKGSPWDPAHTTVKITATASDMETIEVVAAPYVETVTMEIPAGSARTITVIAYDGTQRNTGGHAQIDLTPGEEKVVQIQMLPIPTNLFSPYTGSLAWDYSTITGYVPSKYFIYESNVIDGIYGKITELTFNEWSSGATSGKYYKVSMYFNTYGEGETSDPYLMP